MFVIENTLFKKRNANITHILTIFLVFAYLLDEINLCSTIL